MPTIAFLTNQSLSGSTNVGRILPLALFFAKKHQVALIAHASSVPTPSQENLHVYVSGKDPFTVTKHGKQRLGGIALGIRILGNIVSGLKILRSLHPEVIIISKALPESVAVAWLYMSIHKHVRVIFDVDDFELTANTLSSSLQRAAIAWAERAGARMADTIVVATPFLQDHFSQLEPTSHIELIPTGVLESQLATGSNASGKNILYFGSVSIGSGHRVDLLPAIFELVRRQIPEATLTIAGSGDDIVTLKQQFEIKALGDAVTWKGRFTPVDIPGLLASVAVVVDPVDSSLTNRAKSTSRTVMAAASGIPVVSSDIGIRPDIIPQQLHARLFAEPESTNAYAARIVDVLKKPLTDTEKQILQSSGLRYTWSTLAEHYQTLLV